MAVLRNWVTGDDPTDCDDEPPARCECGDEGCDGGPECPVTVAELEQVALDDEVAAMLAEDGYEGWTCSVCDGPCMAGEPVCSDECEVVWQDALDRGECEERFQ